MKNLEHASPFPDVGNYKWKTEWEMSQRGKAEHRGEAWGPTEAAFHDDSD